MGLALGGVQLSPPLGKQKPALADIEGGAAALPSRFLTPVSVSESSV